MKRGTLSSMPWFYPAVAFAAYTGARRGEVLALRWDDLRLEEQSVTIARSMTDASGAMEFKKPKNDKSRTIALPETLVGILRKHRARQNEERLVLGPSYKDGDLVFAHSDGSPVHPWNFGAAFKGLVKRSGVTPIRLHDLRDTHASLLAKEGVPLEVVSKRLGHSSIAITAERYLVVYNERDTVAAAAFERLVG
jgi:integrase